MRITYFSFIGILFVIGLVNSCAPTLPHIASSLGTKLVLKESKEYRIADIRIDTLDNDSARVFCRVQKAGKQVRGFLDVAVFSPTDEIIFQGSVHSSYPSRGGTYSIGAMGFPFEFKMPLTVLRNNSLHLAFHKYEYKKSGFFKSGEINYAL
ncbi:MAG: hypothetical protein JXA71_09820 [Chitinispirillaceae bacterium]|nr:hypothetical protein [Chitinispirillaceae bacterium]